MSIAQLNPEQVGMLMEVVKVVVILAATFMVAKIVSKVLGKVFKKMPFPEGIERGIVRVSKYLVYIIGLFVVVGFLGVDLTSLVLGLGAFSIAISFATSNIIQNLVSGLIVMSEKAFEIGDVIQIRVGGKEYRGRVAKIGIRSAVLEIEDGNTVFIPNSLFISTPLVKIEDKSAKETQT
ncbi:MAG: mechanosensitive ion channel [Candidatus Bathyarchaeota archaeon]|nr:mechanosensitive ion channel [Candidatus Bathyarchaeota archaeon]